MGDHLRLGLDEGKYKNWVRGAKGLQYLQHGLEGFVGKTARNHRDQELQNIVATLPSNSPTRCNQCTYRNLLPEHAALTNKPCNRKTCIQPEHGKCFGSNLKDRRRCPNGICSKLYDMIVHAHQYKDPMWRNTDPTTWCSGIEGWSFGGRCFQTTSSDSKSANESDASGLLSVMINNTVFQTEIDCDLSSPNNCFATARAKRNDILHSPKMELEDSQLQCYLDAFIDVLKDKKKLLNDPKAQESVKKLEELKKNQIYISINDEKLLMQMRNDTQSAPDLEIETDTRTMEGKQEEVSNVTKMTEKREFQSNSPSRKRRRLDNNYERENTSLNDVQEDLIDFYRSHHRDISLSPLADMDFPLLDLYQMPNLVRVVNKREDGVIKEEREPIDSFKQLFYNTNNNLHGSAYVSADAGLGKTAFSKHLALTWCQAYKPVEDDKELFTQEQLEVMEGFRFVFLLLLRESPVTKCQIDDFIWEQLISKLTRHSKIVRTDLENILFHEKCLIILDGLDEWTHPTTCPQRDCAIPHWNKRENLAVITTTRPWKFNAAGLKSGQIDQRIELIELNQESAKKLKYAFLSNYKKQELNEKHLSKEDEEEVNEEVNRFTQAVSAKHAINLETVPLLCKYMLILWHHGLDLGKTQCELYCQIIELLLSRTDKKGYTLQTPTPEKIPSCFYERKHCLQFYPYLKALGHLAFKTLLKETREEKTLVFDSNETETFLGSECFKHCLKTGIISQSKCVQTNPLVQRSTVSFSHKTVQEFFAALFTYSAPNVTEISKLVLSKCKSVRDILDMSKVIMFISGINTHVAALISSDAMGIINEDKITQMYRRTGRIGSYEQSLKDLQNMFVSCCNEVSEDIQFSLCIQDIFITSSCKGEHHSENIRQLTRSNKQNIKSVHIDMSSMNDSPYNTLEELVEYFELKDLKQVVKIYCISCEDTECVIPTMNMQVKCLNLVMCSSTCSSLIEKVTSLQKLEVINITQFSMSHNELRLLYDFISQRSYMRAIVLWRINCSDHKNKSCSGLRLDLSQQSQLKKFSLYDIPLSELNVNIASLEKCRLWDLSLSSLVFSRIACDSISSEQHTQYVLSGVSMPASGLQDLVTIAQTFPDAFHVEIDGCDINPKSDWESLKQDIKELPHFKLLKEGMKSSSSCGWLQRLGQGP